MREPRRLPRSALEALRRALEEAAPPVREGFGLTWPGKAEAWRLAAHPPSATLVPARDLSLGWDAAEHVLIEGENLEVLKILRASYAGRIKLIYIDPPYNTGGELIYPDDFREGLTAYLRRLEADGARALGTNPHAEASGRLHSSWLSMMAPRLLLARDFLTDDGVCLVSIDDHEVFALRALMNEIFGEAQFLCTLIWNKQHSQQQGIFKKYHEYVLVFAKDVTRLGAIEGGVGEIEAGALKRISRLNPASEFEFPAGVRIDAPDGVVFEGTYGDAEKVTVVRGRLVSRGGRTAEPVTLSAGWTQKNQMAKWFAGQDVRDTRGQKVLEFYFNSSGKLKCRKARTRVTPPTLLRPYGMVSAQTDALASLFDGRAVFDNPKPVAMMGDFLSWFASDGDLVLDFFSGSGTTCEAVLKHDRAARFIGVQLPEPVNENRESGRAARALGLATIADVGRERVRRVIAKLPHPAGFRAYRLAESALAAPKDGRGAKNQGLCRAPADVVTELLLWLGQPLTASVERVPLAGVDVFRVADGAIIICLELRLSLALVRAMIALEPTDIVVRRAAFAADETLARAAAELAERGADGRRAVVLRVW